MNEKIEYDFIVVIISVDFSSATMATELKRRTNIL